MPRVILLSTALLSTCASATEPPPDRDCFRADSARGFSVIDARHVAVSVDASRTYILATQWDVHALDWSQAIAVRSTAGFVCTGNGLGVEIIGGTPPERYPVTSIERAPESQTRTGD